MEKENKLGIIYASCAYLLWGFLPIYWKLLQDIPAGVILAHRIVWSLVFMIILLLVTQNWRNFIKECKLILQDKKKWIGITVASIVISLNWLIFIWAVNSNHVIQASLGYYINPLVSILLGMIILKEKLSRWQLLSFLLALVGVFYLTFSFGVFPWVSLLLAASFGLYGLLKKTVAISAMFGLTIETLIVAPLALIYLMTHQIQVGELPAIFSLSSMLLIGSGIATAVPLLLFAGGAKRIPLSTIGFLQYFAPTIMLVIGVFLFNEEFTHAHVIAFICIWSALAIYTLSKTKGFQRIEAKMTVKNNTMSS